jgi:hypothetical protein
VLNLYFDIPVNKFQQQNICKETETGTCSLTEAICVWQDKYAARELLIVLLIICKTKNLIQLPEITTYVKISCVLALYFDKIALLFSSIVHVYV